jgi:hypothetical protein
MWLSACGSMVLSDSMFYVFALCERKYVKRKDNKSTALPPVLSLPKGRLKIGDWK